MATAFATCSIVLCVALLALAREVRLRRALQRVLIRLLSLWRNPHANQSPLLPPCRLVASIVLGTLLSGCDSDQRVAELSRESLKRQAEQNQEMARQNQAVTETTQQLIESESKIQHDASQLHEQLHSERSNLDQQRQNLEGERRDLAAERQRDSILAQAIPGIVTVVAAALPLVVCWYLARSMFLSDNPETAASEILIEQLATQGPLLTA